MKDFVKKFRIKMENVAQQRKRASAVRRQFVRQPGSGSVAVFGSRSLSVVTALVTLFLQVISFMTTWQGAEVYFGGIFLLAPLLFALAVQSVVYFLSNSMRSHVTAIKVLALVIAICCSTYFSYIGIYHAVNPPKQYLQDRYGEIYENVNKLYQQRASTILTGYQDDVNEIVRTIQSQYNSNASKLEELERCQSELSKNTPSASGKLNPPNRSRYSNYEDYIAAYNAYLASLSGNNGLETSQKKEQILSRYGYTNQAAFSQDLNDARSFGATQETMVADLVFRITGKSPSNPLPDQLNLLQKEVVDGIGGQQLEDDRWTQISVILSGLVGLYNSTASQPESSEEILGGLKLLTSQKSADNAPVIRSFQEMEKVVGKQENSNKAMFDLKSQLDSEVQQAVTKINALSREGTEKLSTQSKDFVIYDMYVLPIKNLFQTKTAGIAFLCLLLAALIDLLTVLFAFILRKHSSVLSMRKVSEIRHGGEELFSKQVLTSLMFQNDGSDANRVEVLIRRLYQFIQKFRTSGIAVEQGYSLSCPLEELQEYAVLVSVLTQMNYAKIVPQGYVRELEGHADGKEDPNLGETEDVSLGNGADMLLLKSKFAIWVNQKFSHYISTEAEGFEIK